MSLPNDRGWSKRAIFQAFDRYRTPVTYFEPSELIDLKLSKLGNIGRLLELKRLEEATTPRVLQYTYPAAHSHIKDLIKEMTNGCIYVKHTQKGYLKRNPLPARGTTFSNPRFIRSWPYVPRALTTEPLPETGNTCWWIN